MKGFLLCLLAVSLTVVNVGITVTLMDTFKPGCKVSWSEVVRDQWRPLYHYTPRANWISDPSGLLVYLGEYHVFYQYSTGGVGHQNTSWGHAVSQDLVSWTEMPPAILADALEEIVSGSALVDRDNVTGLGTEGSPAMLAYYTSLRKAAPHYQHQALAFSLDLGRTWTKYAGNPIIGGNQTAFRDPRVIRVADGWMMLVQLSEKRSLQFYKSTDLIHWRQVGQFPNEGSTAGAVGGVWEHPDLFQLEVDGDPGNTKWVLVVNVNPGNQYGKGSAAQYFLGDFDGERFVDDDGGGVTRWLDHGMDYYAAGSFAEMPDSRRVMIGWMSNWAYGERVPTGTWANGLSVAREVRLRTISGRLGLTQQPVQGLDALRRGPVLHGSGITLHDGEHTEEDMQGLALDIQVTFTWIDAAEFGAKVHVSRDRETVIGFRKKGNGFELFVDRTNSGVDDFSHQFSGVHRAPVQPDKNGKLVLRILVDAVSVEVFGGQGEVVITDLVFPDQEEHGVSFFAREGAARIDSFAIWRLGPVSREENNLV